MVVSKWLPESEWLARVSELPDSEKVSQLQAALNDCPASAQLYLMLVACHTDEQSRQQVLQRALSSPAIWDLQHGYALWLELGDSEADAAAVKRAVGIPYERVDLLAEKFPHLGFPSESPLPPLPAATTDFDEFVAAVSRFPAAAQTRLSLTRCWLEQQLSYSTSSWLRYLRFLERELPVNALLIDVASRFTRALPDRKESWVALMDGLLLAGCYEEVLVVAVEDAPLCEQEIWLLKLAALGATADTDKIVAFIKDAIAAFPSERKFIKMLALHLLRRGAKAEFRNVWKHSLLKTHAKDLSLWLEYIRLEAVAGGSDCTAAIASAFKQAAASITDAKDRDALFAEWLNHERLYGDAKSLLEVKARLPVPQKVAEAAAGSAELPPSKRPRVDSSAAAAGRFDPLATLFVNNLPYSFTRDDIAAFFAPVPVKSLRMHMNGAAFKGHATVEFDSQATAAALIQSHNRRVVQGRPVFLAPYQSPLMPAAPSALSTKDPKTLFVSQLPADTDTAAISAAFSGIDGVREIRHTPGKRFAYVEFSGPEQAQAALARCSEIRVGGRVVGLAVSEPPVKRKADERDKQTLLSMRPRSLRK